MSELTAFELRTELQKGRFKMDEHAYQQILALINIFYAKEISKGPIKKDISERDLIEWLQGLNQAATAMKDHYVMKTTTQFIEMIQKPGIDEQFIGEKGRELFGWSADPKTIKECEDFIRNVAEEIQRIGKDWLPTAENINALPEPVRNYIAAMQTNADPPSMVADNIIMKNTIKTLEKMLGEKPAVDEGFVNTWAKEFQADTPADSSLNERLVKKLLIEAGVDVIKI